MKLTWIENGFESEEYFAPFTVNKDCDYFTDLQERYNKLISQAKGAGADDKSIAILEKSEYIISQAIMMACMKLGYDGVAYFSKRVSNEIFAYCAINLALFVRYDYQSKLLNHIKIDDPFNYSVYKQLLPSLKYKDYDLRTTAPGKITNIGSFDRQYPYSEINFNGFTT